MEFRRSKLGSCWNPTGASVGAVGLGLANNFFRGFRVRIAVGYECKSQRQLQLVVSEATVLARE